MKSLRGAAWAAVLGIILSGCGTSPTAEASAALPSYDGGFGIGSGNRDAPPSSATGADVTQADTPGRGGFTMGSGG